MDKKPLGGIHHVTMISGDAQANVDFYVGILGLRLVKRTVNFDDPGTYHLYYGNPSGAPGTLLTFFPHPDGYKGRVGAGQTGTIGLEVPAGSLEAWMDLFVKHDVSFDMPETRFGQRVVSFKDGDGLMLELVETPDAMSLPYWQEGPHPAELAIRGVHSVTLLEDEQAPTEDLLLNTMGAKLLGEEAGRYRYELGEENFRFVDVIYGFDERGRVAVGSVHHVAFRVADDANHAAWQQTIAERHQISEILNRDYFRSVYFREPGGVLFELATDAPGMAVDEPLATLGEEIRIPSWLEPRRDLIIKRLRPLNVPTKVSA